jgi:hypothetical protein
MGWDNQGDSRCRDILTESQKVGQSVGYLSRSNSSSFCCSFGFGFVSGLELSGGMCLSTSSQAQGTKAAGAAGRHQKAFWHLFYPSSAIRLFAAAAAAATTTAGGF